MSRIALVVSDVDGTLVTSDKRLTEATLDAVARLHAAGIGFTITSSRPPFGMTMLLQPLAITLPFGPFNGSSIIDPHMQILSQTTIPLEASRIALKILSDFGIDIWMFTNNHWLIARDDGTYVPHERNTIRFDPLVVRDFAPHLANACKIVGASGDAERLKECESVMQRQLGPLATATRSQSYYLDITPPDQNKGVFVSAMTRRLGLTQDRVAAIGDMINDISMFSVSGLSVAMGNAADDVKAAAKHVTASNYDEGFAAAIAFILANNEGS